MLSPCGLIIFVRRKNIEHMNIKNNILDFCQKYQSWLEQEKEKDDESAIRYGGITFYCASSRLSFDPMPTACFMLDAEDLKYLHDKYSAKLRDELERNISEVKEAYNGIIGKGKE